MKLFKKIASLVAAAVVAMTSVQVTAGAASTDWMKSAKKLTSGETVSAELPENGGWLDYTLTAKSDGIVVIDAKVCASKSKIMVCNSKGSSVSTSSKVITGTANGSTYTWNKVSEYSEFTRSFKATEGSTYYIRLAKGAKTATGSMKTELTVTIPTGNPFKNSQVIKFGKVQTVDLDTKNEEAYFTVDAPSDGVISLGFDFEVSAAQAALYDSDGNRVVPTEKTPAKGTCNINTTKKYGSMNWSSKSKSGSCSFDFNVGAGRYYIWVSNTGGSSGSGIIKMTPSFYSADNAELTMLSVRVPKGGSIQLLATIEGKATVQWSSSDTGVATVSSTGKVVGKKKGNAVITATCAISAAI